MATGQLTYYYHLLSQPSRVLKILLDANKIPYTSKVVNLLQGEHLQENFANLNRFKRVPIIKHNDFILTESVAIARYLCRETNIPDEWYPKDSIKQAKVDEFLEWQHIDLSVAIARYLCRELNIPDAWYPKDSVKQARVDEFLEWHHIDLRYSCGMFVQIKFLRPLLIGKPPSQEKIDLYRKIMEKSCNQMENLWLKDGTPYLCGDHITIADLFGACELEQPRMAGYDPRDGRPKLSAWLSRVENHLQPHYTNAHEFVNSVTAKHKGVPPSTVSKL